MSAFAILKSDDKVFEGDKLQLDASQSFVTPDDAFAATSHQISFDAGSTWINITTLKKLDYIFSTSGDKTIQLKVTSTGGTQTVSKTVTVLDLTEQALFSKDADLYLYEPEIDRYLPKKWSSWNLIHLAAQQFIIDWLDENAITKSDGEKFAVADFGDSQQVKQLSCFKALELIYEGNSNVVGDLSSVKRDKYKGMVIEKLSRANLRLDYNDDGTIDTNEKINLMSGTLVRT
jgi:PKD repeat protein